MCEYSGSVQYIICVCGYSGIVYSTVYYMCVWVQWYSVQYSVLHVCVSTVVVYSTVYYMCV